jgi:transcriptional regulator with XRE-family HTH domain
MIASDRHLRAARALAGLSQEELAKLANVSIATIKRMEKFGGFDGLIGIPATTIRIVEEALEATGVAFTKDGVRMRLKRSKSAR